MAKEKKSRPRSQRLPGVDDAAIQALETAAEEYVEIRDERMELTTREVKLKNRVLNVMKQHSKKIYKRDGIEIRIVESDEDVKVKVKKPKESDEE